jgi:DNA-binding XRE family transcriptional regulator
MKLTLKALRANKKWTQADAAKAIGINEATWANYEKGKTYPDVPIINKIEKVFNVSYSDILFLPQSTIKS